MAEDNKKVIQINCYEHIYPDKTKVELCGIDFIVYKGEKVAVLGPNGGGKTTLIKHIIGLLSPNKGEVRVLGVNPAKELEQIREQIGVVFQNTDEQLIGPTVLDDIMFSPLNFGYSYDEALTKAQNIMNKLGIFELKDKVIHYLSGGEKRKVALAGALVLNPALLILDEPFSGLDNKSQKEFVNLINNITKELKISVVISTHDVESVAEFADVIYLVSKTGMSAKGTPSEILFNDELLRKFNLEPPNLIKLVSILKQNGIELNDTLTIESLAEDLIGRMNI